MSGGRGGRKRGAADLVGHGPTQAPPVGGRRTHRRVSRGQPERRRLPRAHSHRHRRGLARARAAPPGARAARPRPRRRQRPRAARPAPRRRWRRLARGPGPAGDRAERPRVGGGSRARPRPRRRRLPGQAFLLPRAGRPDPGGAAPLRWPSRPRRPSHRWPGDRPDHPQRLARRRVGSPLEQGVLAAAEARERTHARVPQAGPAPRGLGLHGAGGHANPGRPRVPAAAQARARSAALRDRGARCGLPAYGGAVTVALAVCGWLSAFAAAWRVLVLMRRLELVACAEHELRGPLAALTLAAGRSRPVPAPVVEGQLERARLALADLTEARRGRRAPSHAGRHDLALLAKRAAAAWNVKFEWHAGRAPIDADPGRIAQALGNLLS